MFRRSAAALVLAAVSSAAAPAQVTYPLPPDRYDAHVRYRIAAGRDERVRQFRAMTAGFEKLGFVPAEREDADLDVFDPLAERTHGTIPAANAAKLLADPRVLAVVLVPAGTALPDDGQKPVQIRVALSSGLAPAQQKLLHDQTAARLAKLGFREATAYDHGGHTRLRGTLPAGNLLTLLRDVRFQPTGWFVTADPPDSLPLPLRSVYPVRLVEVLPDAPAAAAPAADPAASPAAAKITDDLRAVLAVPENADKPLRVEVVFDAEPLGGLRDLELTFRTAVVGATPDGLVGTVGSVRLRAAADVAKVAEMPEVQAVRLPRAGHATTRPVAADAPGAVPVAKLLADTRLADLHRAGFRGQGTRVVLVGADFPGAADLVGKGLGAGTRVLDLTAELDPSLSPAPAGPDVGTTAAALALQAAAPDAMLTLVRVDPAAFHQLLTVARTVSGDRSYSLAMQVRSGEIIRRTEEMAARRIAVLEEYRLAFNDLSDEDAPTKRRAAAAAAVEKLRADEATLRGVADRFAALKAGVDGLAGAGVVVNTLVWEDGFPNDGQSELSRQLDARFVGVPTRSAIKAAQQPAVPGWVQAGSGRVGSVWAGPFVDADATGALEFAPPNTALPPKRWTRELNFLRLEPRDGPAADALPAGLQVRISVQWREPHDPADVYAPDPVYPVELRVLRQTDPDGKAAASDDMTEVARSTGPVVRLLRTPGAGVYELSMLFTVPADGVYALRVDHPRAGDRFLSARHTTADIRPRIVLQAGDAASAEKGRVVFGTFAPRAVGVGIPGDSPTAVTVGVGGGPGFATPESLTAAGPAVTLRTKPDLLTAGVIAVGDGAVAGPGAATGFVGGAAASLRSAGVRPTDVVRIVGLKEGGAFALPPAWLTHVGPRTERPDR